MNNRIVVWFVCVGAWVAVAACSDGTAANSNTLMVSIEPLRYIVEEITGRNLEVAVLVPLGASPETYEPTALQIKAAEDAKLIFSTGLVGFENILLERLPAPERFVDLSAGIELVAATPTKATGHEHGSYHHGGVDPHIWVAPRALARMASTAYGRIHELYPDSTSYTANYKRLEERLKALDREVAERVASTPTRSFLIFHPGLTYYARDYGLRQIAIESDGKEPSARELAGVIALSRAENITKVLYQKEFPRRIVEVAAAEIGAEPVEIDILSYDIVGNILKITESIAGTPSDAAAETLSGAVSGTPSDTTPAALTTETNDTVSQ